MKIVWIISLGIMFIYATELEQQRQACKNNNPQSCYKAGVILTTGVNAEDQEKKALGLEYIRKACKFGENKACDAMGENYFNDKHYGAARPYLIESCKRKVVTACTALGTIYRDGHDVKQDDVQSREYYEQACALGSKDSCINVAIIYRGGFGVVKSRSEEKVYYEKACRAGSAIGCDNYRRMDNQDKGIKEPTIFDKFKSLFN